MDESRFDALTRALTAARSRRRLARLLSGLAVSGPLALLGIDQTEAKGKKKKKRKKGSPPAPSPSPPPLAGCTGSCAGKVCGAGDGCSNPCQTGSCADGKTCQSGQCVSSGCPAGTRDCGAAGCQECCYGQAGSDNQCCPADRPDCHRDSVYGIYKRCAAGAVCQCPATYPAWCAFDSAPASCHSCCTSNDCSRPGDRPTCWYGNCVCPAEAPDWCPVATGPTEKKCTNHLTDEANCGWCGRNCGTGFTCVNGNCAWQGG